MTPKLRPIAVATGLLAGFALVGTLLVALIFDTTAIRIADNQAALERARILELIEQIDVANDPLHDHRSLSDPRLGEQSQTVWAARDAEQRVRALIFSATTERGYNGHIALLVALNLDGRVLGARVTRHRETPGLGDAIERDRSRWIESFTGRSLTDPEPAGWNVRRQGGEFDQFTGATITPRAVIHAVRNVLAYFDEHRTTLLEAFEPEAPQPVDPALQTPATPAPPTTDTPAPSPPGASPAEDQSSN